VPGAAVIAAAPLLEATGLRRAFGGVLAVDDVSFTVLPGQIKAIIGPNGAGKTTVFNIISGILRPDSGRVAFAGMSIAGLPPYRIGEIGISRTFQNLSLFANMSVLENVMVGCHCRNRCGIVASVLRLPRHFGAERTIRAAAERRLAAVGMADKASAPVASLPFGQRRLVELARALATEPRLLLLDEPASGLNTRETSELARIVRQVRDAGVTVLLVEHDMSLVMDVSDSILVLNYGKPVMEGSPAAVRADPNVIAVYLGGAFGSAAN
jgi:branched-chain amino acid transport system ATP-binding protein